MHDYIKIIILTIIVSLPPMICLSQHDTTYQKPHLVILNDGSELVGNIVSEDSISINFKTYGNISMSIPKNQVKSIEILQGDIINGEYIRFDPNQTRLFFAPTARPLKAGQGYFSAYEIFFPFLAVGVTDYLTLAGGFSLIPGANSQLLYLAPKITPVQIDKFSLAGGVLYLNSTSGGADGAGIIYTVGTYGDQSASFTAGLGWGFYGSDIADKPVLMLGGEARLSNHTKFITENWIPPNSDVVILSFGIRFFGENLAADLGFIRPTISNTSGFPFIPWLGFAYNFGKTK
jgi:hypothetical protein